MIKLDYLLRIIFSIAIISFFSSCVTRKEITYFLKEDTTQRAMLQPYEPIIQSHDRISILVTAVDKRAVNFFTFSLNDNSSTAPSYLVNAAGIVDVPLVGEVTVAGLTTTQAKDTLKKLIEKFVINPTVIVILKTFRVTVLGAVNGVGVLESDNEKMSLTEAIAKAGDIQINGRRDNIMVIRDKGNGKEYGSVDLTSKNVFTSPYYYLHANDIIYIEPGIRTRLAANEIYFASISIGLSFITLILVYSKKY